MNEKILIEICVGTYSYVMGGAELVNLESKLPEHLAGKVQVKGVVELDGVDEATMKPPYAAVNGKVITQATAIEIIAAIENELKSETV